MASSIISRRIAGSDARNGTEETMNDEALNMSIRKFLKTVGVNSQLAIEKAVRKAIDEGKLSGNESFPATMTLTVGKLALEVKFDGDIKLG
jgi:hypothetical protein